MCFGDEKLVIICGEIGTPTREGEIDDQRPAAK
jgi:hypothetical protein